MSEWLAKFKESMIHYLDKHLVDDWRDAYKFLSNHVLLLIGVIEIAQQYFGDILPPHLVGVLAIVGVVLRVWNQGASRDDTTN